MGKLNWKARIAALEARKVEERALLLAAGLALLAYAWLVFFHDAMQATQQDMERRITIASSQILEQTSRQAEIESTFSSDPNNFALQRQRELREAAESVNSRLDQLYGTLISPQEMSLVLTSILQRETALELISLENLPSQALVTTEMLAADGSADADLNIQVFRHGLRMVFSGSFLETVRLLRSLEQLDSNFFWESLDFSVTAHPNASITLDVYTLSTERGWIGV